LGAIVGANPTTDDLAERMRLIIDSVRDYAIFMLDAGGHITTWSAGAELTKGYKAADIIGKSLEVFYTPEDRARGLPRQLLAAAARDGRVESEGWRVRKDGTRFWADVIITAIRNDEGQLVGFAKVTRDLTEKRLADDERLKLARAEEAVRLRDEFLSIASHELKTPLTALMIQLHMLRETGAALDAKTLKKVERAARSTDQLNRLIDALLDVSRLATGRLSLDRRRLDLAESLHQLVDTLQGAAAKAGSQLTFESDGPVVGCWDQMRVQQVVTNLISNSLKYGAGKPIVVSLIQLGGEAVIQVRDYGPGIRDDDMPRIFDRFERAAPSRHYGGLGLGLYISRQIATAHGGSISAQNDPDDGGARFTIRLPLELPPSRPAGVPLH
jgi:PAS domain S-box-containing protein